MHKRGSDLAIMDSPAGPAKSLTLVMLTGILLGALSLFCAIFIVIFGDYGAIQGLVAATGSEAPG